MRRLAAEVTADPGAAAGSRIGDRAAASLPALPRPGLRARYEGRVRVTGRGR
jgi:hypothetical protein